MMQCRLHSLSGVIFFARYDTNIDSFDDSFRFFYTAAPCSAQTAVRYYSQHPNSGVLSRIIYQKILMKRAEI